MVEYITYQSSFNGHKKGDIRCCIACGCKLTTENSAKRRKDKNTYHSDCRTCISKRSSEYHRERYANDAEFRAHDSASTMNWRAKNRERHNKTQRIWSSKNRDRLRASKQRHAEKSRSSKATQNTIATFMALNKIAEDDNA